MPCEQARHVDWGASKHMMEFPKSQGLFDQSLHIIALVFQHVPGSAIATRYISSRYQSSPIFLTIELLLLVFSVHYLCAKEYRSRQRATLPLSEEEIDELVEDWTPEPFVEPLTSLETAVVTQQPVIAGPPGPRCKLTSGRTVVNLASSNFYNFAGNEAIKQNAIDILRKYGVGPCSAPGFYGTQDIHMDIEAKIASFIGTESCIVYAHAFSTISSLIPSFAKRGDVIVADIACNYPIRKGIQISRCNVHWYKHNDMEDLERILAKVVKESKMLTRRFIVSEGLSENVGDVVNLPKMIDLKTKYKFRLILDETWSFGVLGQTGRGVTEAQNVDISHVDMLAGSLSGPLSGAGGFCASSRHVVEHQRINSTAYCYSCAVPAMLAATAAETISMLEANPEILVACRSNINVFRSELAKCPWVESTSSPQSPVQLLTLDEHLVRSQEMGVTKQEQILQDCVDECLLSNILITRLKSMPTMLNSTLKEQEWAVRPALKVCITTGLSEKEIKKAGSAIRLAIIKVLTRKTAGKLTIPKRTLSEGTD